ncbi:MAG: hypothetical protein K2N22_04190 [Clostridia bacterium]|nr:hypothetical protein [Clostridia bacterium]
MALTKTKKIILISALEGLAAIALAALLVFSLWILCSPQTMATASEKAGNYSFAVTCADLKYKYSKNTSDLARCVQDSILSGKDKDIIKYGDKFIGDSKFEEVCATRGEKYGVTFADYVIGNVAAAKYRKEGLQEAVNTCKKGTGKSFIWLTLEVKDGGNAEDIKGLSAELENLTQDETIKNLLQILDTGE